MKIFKTSKKSTLVICLVLAAVQMSATHFRAGEIIYKRLPPFTSSNYEYLITIIKYTDNGINIADRCQDSIFFGDGQKAVVNRSNDSQVLSPCGCANDACGEMVFVGSYFGNKRKSIYTIVHKYSGPGAYRITVTDYNRNAGISNIAGSVNTPFTLEALIMIYSNLEGNASPEFARAPFEVAFVNNPCETNSCAFDADGDSLSYELVVPLGGNTLPLTNYTVPAPSAGGSIGIDPITGTFYWKNPPLVGLYQFAVKVTEWRKMGCWMSQAIGYVVREFEVDVSGTQAMATIQNTTPIQLCMREGSVLQYSLQLNGQNVQSFVPTILSKQFAGGTSTVSSLISYTVGSARVALLSFTAACENTVNYPQFQYLRFESNNVYSSAYCLPISIQVLSAEPQTLTAQSAVSSVSLNWQPPVGCGMRTIKNYKIYRKFGASTWNDSNCSSYDAANQGYSFLAMVDGSTIKYTDGDLWHISSGTQVNYLVTAVIDNCNESAAAATTVTNLVVGIQHGLAFKNITCSPNPVKETLLISGDARGDIELALCSVEGKVCLQQKSTLKDGILALDVSSFSSGVYFLKIGNATENKVIRVIKE